MRRFVVLLLFVGACQSADVSRTIGARCDRSNECDDRCLGGADWPGGFCTIDCDTSDGCVDDSSCVDEGGGGVCLFNCRDDRGCAFLGAGYKCTDRDAHQPGAPKVMVCRGG
jgi:hypothetical protein